MVYLFAQAPVDINANWHWAVYIVISLAVGLMAIVTMLFKNLLIPYWKESADLYLDRQRKKLESDVKASEANLKLIQRSIEFLEKSKSAKDEVRDAIVELTRKQNELHDLIDELTSKTVDQMMKTDELIEAHHNPEAGKLFETQSLKRAISTVINHWLETGFTNKEDIDKAVREADEILKQRMI